MRMWTDDCAPSMSSKMRGKKFAPSTHGSIVAAVDHAKSSAASCGRVPLRAANALVAASAPAGVTASGGGGQLGFWVIPSTCLYTRTNRAAATSATTARPWRPRFRAPVLASSRIAGGSYRPRRGGISRGVGCVRRRRRRGAGCVPDVDECREREPRWDARPEQRVARRHRRGLRSRLDPPDGSRLMGRSGRGVRRVDRHVLDGRWRTGWTTGECSAVQPATGWSSSSRRARSSQRPP